MVKGNIQIPGVCNPFPLVLRKDLRFVANKSAFGWSTTLHGAFTAESKGALIEALGWPIGLQESVVRVQQKKAGPVRALPFLAVEFNAYSSYSMTCTV